MSPVESYETAIRGIDYVFGVYSEGYKQIAETLKYMEDMRYSHLTRKEREADIQPIRNSKTDPKTGRNQPCTCGSGKKYKYCCLKP